MKRIAILVFVLAATVFAEEMNIESVAEDFETSTDTVQTCMDDAGRELPELRDMFNAWYTKFTSGDINNDAKEAFMPMYRFIACMLEKKEVMTDSRLVLDKISEHMDKKGKVHLFTNIKSCVETLNGNNGMDREDRAIGLVMCMIPAHGDGKK